MKCISIRNAVSHGVCIGGFIMRVAAASRGWDTRTKCADSFPTEIKFMAYTVIRGVVAADGVVPAPVVDPDRWLSAAPQGRRHGT